MVANNIYEDGTYFKNNPTWDVEDSPWKANHVLKILQRNNIIPSTICEIGCGAGEILNCLSSAYGNNALCSGYEISPQAFGICKNKEKHNLHYYLCDMLNEDVKFDVALAIDVIEHVEDYFQFLRKLREKAVYKVFHIPLDLSLQSILLSKPILHVREIGGHINYFTKDIALKTLEDTGYDVVDYFYTDDYSGLPLFSWNVNLRKLPRNILFRVNQDLTARFLCGFSLMILAK